MKGVGSDVVNVNRIRLAAGVPSFGAEPAHRLAVH